MSSVLGVDVGTVRVGLAKSDPDRVVATPLATLPGGKGLEDRLAERARDEGCHTVVVGLPRALSGAETDSTRLARAVAEGLRRRGLAVELYDERLSSAQAERALLAGGRRRAQRRAERDKVAATVVLQSWLDARRSSGRSRREG